MCQKCVDACRLHFPDCPDEEMGEFLSGTTCFPLGGPEEVERQLIEAKDAGNQSWQEAMVWADNKMWEWMVARTNDQQCEAMMRL